MHHSTVLSIALCVFAAAAQEAPKPQFTARELFYSASDAPAKPAATPTPKPTTPPPAPAPKPTVAVKKPPVQTAPTQSAAVITPAEPVVTSPASQPSQPISRPEGATVVKAALVTAPAPATGTPLGLKYTILKKSGDDMVEVSPDTTFHAGDRVQLSVQTNGPGYLYIILRGTSGTWTPMFPSPEVADGNNHVNGWNASVLPPGSRMVFDTQTGTEHLFIVFSRTPEDGLENMIYSLQDGVKAKPASDKAVDKSNKKYVMTASANIPDATVGHLRDTYTRDLVIEKVDDKTPEDKSSANKKENAVYVVNPSGSSDSRVVADVQLVHQ
jgi:hypothetical protein